MAFKKAQRLDQKQYTNVAPISSEMAKYAKGTEMSERDLLHELAMERASKLKDEPLVIGAKEQPAKYKIEVRFDRDRTVQGPNTCKITFWESGSKFHGGGDAMMSICRNSQNASEGCGAIFSQDFIRDGVAICPKCNSAINSELLTSGLIRDNAHRLSTRELARHLVRFWHQLGGNADFYFKFHQEDRQPKPFYESSFGTLRKNKALDKAIYPLSRIITDTSAGATLETCVYNFLTA